MSERFLPSDLLSLMRRTLLRLILIVGGSLVGLGLGEIIVRAFHLGYTRTIVEYNDKLLKLRPHAGFMNYRENTNWVEINNLGFHDRDRQAASDNYRILFVGDSFLDGRQVDTDSLFTSRLEKRFAGEGSRIEVINAGVPGTGTAYQYVLWKEFLEPQLKVDHLVLCIYLGNDLVDNNADLADPESGYSIFLDEQGNIVQRKPTHGRLMRIVNFFRDHSALLNTSYENAYRLKKSFQGDNTLNGGPYSPGEGPAQNMTSAWEASEEGTLTLIKRWKAELSAKKIPFDLVIIDRPGKLYNKFELSFAERLKSVCAQNQIEWLRLKLTADPFDTYSFDGIALGHFNERGHALVADELYDFLKSRHGALLTHTSESRAAAAASDLGPPN